MFSHDSYATFAKSLHCRDESTIVHVSLSAMANAMFNQNFDFRQRVLVIRRRGQGRSGVISSPANEIQVYACGSVAHSGAHVATSCDGNATISQKFHCRCEKNIAHTSVA